MIYKRKIHGGKSHLAGLLGAHKKKASGQSRLEQKASLPRHALLASRAPDCGIDLQLNVLEADAFHPACVANTLRLATCGFRGVYARMRVWMGEFP